MAFTSVTYTFTNSTTADATQVNTNYTDIINGISDGTKDMNISALTCAGAVTVNAAVTLGASTVNDLTFNGSIASHIPVKTNTSYDFGTSTIGLRSIYIGGTSTFTTRIVGGTQTGSMTLTLPIVAPTVGQVLSSSASGVLSWSSPLSVIANNPGSAITGSFTDITGWTSVEDTDSAFNVTTGVFTAPKAGLYGVVASFFAGLSAAVVNQSIDAGIALNTTLGSFKRVVLAAGLGSVGFGISATIRLAVNDKITIQTTSSNGGAGFTGSGPLNYLNIYLIH